MTKQSPTNNEIASPTARNDRKNMTRLPRSLRSLAMTAIKHILSEKYTDTILEHLHKNTVLIGVGNILSGDDGFGPRLIERVKPALNEHAIDAGLAPENWTGPIAKLAPDTLIIADAVAFDGKAGEIRLLIPEDLESGMPATHGPGLSSFIEYIRQSLPQTEIIILAVQPDKTGLGNPMSEAVEKAIEEIVGALANS